jgi:glucose/arabinose dehydrogenase
MNASATLRLSLALLLLLSCSPGRGGESEASPQTGAIGAQAGKAASKLPLDRIKLPPGFRIDSYSEAVPGARSMALSSSGILYVGTMARNGKVFAVVDRDKDGRADQVFTVASGLNTPNGVAWKDGSLYVAEISRVLRYDGIDQRLQNPPQPKVVVSDYPSDRHHGWKFIRFGPDGNLYIPVGAPCNVCDEKNPIYASITRVKPDGTGREIYAKGIRNSVGFDWHPGTKELWFTDNGRDMLGDDVPSDELNRAPKAGLHFGFPYCHQGDIPDPDFGKGKACKDYTPPARKLGPHVAAIGMRFYTGAMFPAEYKNQIFIAEHGSWNRSKPIGYRVMLVRLKGNEVASYEPFAQGWLAGDGDSWGRPADVQVMPDGALLVSDDRVGAIYRISYAGGGKR